MLRKINAFIVSRFLVLSDTPIAYIKDVPSSRMCLIQNISYRCCWWGNFTHSALERPRPLFHFREIQPPPIARKKIVLQCILVRFNSRFDSHKYIVGFAKRTSFWLSANVEPLPKKNTAHHRDNWTKKVPLKRLCANLKRNSFIIQAFAYYQNFNRIRTLLEIPLFISDRYSTSCWSVKLKQAGRSFASILNLHRAVDLNRHNLGEQKMSEWWNFLLLQAIPPFLPVHLLAVLPSPRAAFNFCDPEAGLLCSVAV